MKKVLSLILFALLWADFSDLQAQCVTCDRIYVWDFITENGTPDRRTSKISRQAGALLSRMNTCELVPSIRFSPLFEEADITDNPVMLDVLKFNDLREGQRDTLKAQNVKVVVFGTLFEESKNSVLGISFEYIGEDPSASFLVSKDITFQEEELSDSRRIEEKLKAVFDDLICREIVVDMDDAEQIQEAMKRQASRLEALLLTPFDRRDKKYYFDVNSTALEFKKYYKRYQELYPSVKRLGKFKDIDKEFEQKVSDVGFDLTFAKLYEKENDYDNLYKQLLIGNISADEPIQNREACIELCDLLINHPGADDEKVSSFETIKLNCYKDLQILYSKSENKQKEMASVSSKIQDLTPDLQKVLRNNMSLGRIAGKPINMNIRFKRGTAEIETASFEELHRLGDLLDKFPESTIELAGHTDDIGEKVKLQELSEQRARAVRDHLIEVRKIETARITGVAGYGGRIPVASNADEEMRKLNRRVEVIFKAK